MSSFRSHVKLAAEGQPLAGDFEHSIDADLEDRLSQFRHSLDNSQAAAFYDAYVVHDDRGGRVDVACWEYGQVPETFGKAVVLRSMHVASLVERNARDSSRDFYAFRIDFANNPFWRKVSELAPVFLGKIMLEKYGLQPQNEVLNYEDRNVSKLYDVNAKLIAKEIVWKDEQATSGIYFVVDQALERVPRWDEYPGEPIVAETI